MEKLTTDASLVAQDFAWQPLQKASGISDSQARSFLNPSQREQFSHVVGILPTNHCCALLIIPLMVRIAVFIRCNLIFLFALKAFSFTLVAIAVLLGAGRTFFRFVTLI